MEHCPISVKLEVVPIVQISGVSCSTDGVVLLSDRNKSLIYRLDIEDGTSFSFGKAALSRLMQTFFPLEDFFDSGRPEDVSVSAQNVFVLDQQGIHIFSMMGIWLKMLTPVFSLERIAGVVRILQRATVHDH